MYNSQITDKYIVELTEDFKWANPSGLAKRDWRENKSIIKKGTQFQVQERTVIWGRTLPPDVNYMMAKIGSKWTIRSTRDGRYAELIENCKRVSPKKVKIIYQICLT